jgi:hypothetical protein
VRCRKKIKEREEYRIVESKKGGWVRGDCKIRLMEGEN